LDWRALFAESEGRVAKTARLGGLPVMMGGIPLGRLFCAETVIISLNGANTMSAYMQQSNKWFFGIISSIAIACVLLSSATASAELLSYAGSAISGWSGTKNYSAMGKLIVDVQYAVYAPGDFPLAGYDPGPGQYVYAYQLINRDASTDGIQKLTIGLDADALPQNIAELPDPDLPGGVPSTPSFTGFPPGSAAWTYSSAVNVTPGSKSEVLLFTSQFGPQWKSSTLRGFGVGVIGNVPNGLPSPVPEPAAALGLLVAGGLFVFVRLSRRTTGR
jgi:hypothetical protein